MKLCIKFREEGGYFREIDETRQYFLSEAEEIIKNIRMRLKKEKRTTEPKPFEYWFDHKQLVVTYIDFNDQLTIEEQLKQTILNYDGWEESVRYQYVNRLNEYGEIERSLFLNQEFRAFAIRYNQEFNESLVLGIQELKMLFDGVYPHVSTGFYSEMEKIIKTIGRVHELVAKKSSNEKNLSAEDFNRLVQYVAAGFQSVLTDRLIALYTRFEPYIAIELFLFQEAVETLGFDKCFEVHNEMKKEIEKKYNDILFEGFVLENDEMLESLVISPVVKTRKKELELLIKEKDEMRIDTNET